MLSLYFDGSCFPVGTEAHGAYIIKDGDTVLKEDNFLEAKEGTNNIAEWGGLVAGLRYLREHHPDASIQIFGDSQLVIRQLTGAYACKKPHLQPYLREAHALLDGVTWEATWVRRIKNQEADKLSKKRSTPPDLLPVAVEDDKVDYRHPCGACNQRGYFPGVQTVNNELVADPTQRMPCPDCFGKGYIKGKKDVPYAS